MKSQPHTAADSIEPTAAPASHNHEHTRWDQLGIAGSLLCTIHCAATPLLIGYLSVAGLGFLGDELIHQVLAVLLTAIALLAFIPGWRRHGRTAIALVGGVGVTLILSASFLLHPFVSHTMETVITALGSVILIAAHGLNWKLSQASGCQDDCPS